MTSTTPKRRRRWLRRLLWIVCGLAGLVAIAAGAGVWRLSRGPVRLDFLQPRIENALDELIAPLSIRLGSTALTWVGGEVPVEVAVANVQLRNPAGVELASFPKIGLGLFKPALLRGRMIPTSLVVRGARAKLVRNADGSFDLGLGGADESAGGEAAVELSTWLDAWAAPAGADAPLSRLSTIGVHALQVTVQDRMAGVDWSAERIEVTVERKGRALHADASLKVRSGDRETDLGLDADYRVEGGALDVGVEFQGLAPAILAGYPGLEPLAALDRPLRGSVQLLFQDATRLRQAHVDLTDEVASATGELKLSDQGPTLAGSVTARQLEPWTFAGLSTELEPLSRVRFPLDAQVAFEVAGQKLRSLQFDLTGGRGTIDLPELYPRPLELSSTTVRGSIAGDLERITIDEATVVLPDTRLTASLSARKTGDGYDGELTAGAGAIDLTRLATYWPPSAGPGAREWVLNGIPSGTVRDARLDLSAGVVLGDSPELALRELNGSFRFDELVVDALPPQPALSGVSGQATFSDSRMDFRVERGAWGRLEVGPSTVALTDLDSDAERLSIEAGWSGPLATAVEILSAEPLTLFEPDLLAELRGKAAGTLELGLPLSGEITVDRMHISTQARLADVSWSEGPLPEGLQLGHGDLRLTATDESIEVRGNLQLNGVPMAVEYREDLAGGEPLRRIEARGRLDAVAAGSLGLPEQPYVSGATDVDLIYVGHGDGSSEVRARADLAEALLRIPELDWSKPVGEPAGAMANARLTPDGVWEIHEFDVTTAELKTSGSLELSSDPVTLRRVEVGAFELGGNDLQGSLSFDPRTGYRVRVTGSRFDAAPWIRHAEGEDGTGTDPAAAAETHPALDLELVLDELYLPRDTRLGGVRVRVAFDGRQWQELRLGAVMDSGENLIFEFGPGDDGHELRFEAGGLNDLFQSFQIPVAIQGGHAVLTASGPSPAGPFEGQFTITDFTLLDAPQVAKVLELGSLRGMLTSFHEEGLKLNKIDGELTYRDRRLELANGRALGEGFGLTCSGATDFEESSVTLDGAVTPARTIQRVLGDIPLLGRVLTGWKKEGLVAVLYTIRGPIGGAEVQVRKFSALTPGITREIFQLAPDGHEPRKKKKTGKREKKETAVETDERD